MIEKEHGYFTCACDYCGLALAGFKHRKSARQAMQERGWQIGNIEREWIDYCPNCAGIYKAELEEYRNEVKEF